ncbi:MAG: hypothetical protein WDO13_07710 [Verrucomicrobiota bacterium]
MKKFKIKLSVFDIGMLIAFAVVTLAGVGAWWYLSGALQDAQAADAQAKHDFDTYSSKSDYVVSASNLKTLHGNSDILQAQIDPVLQASLLQKGNDLHTIEKEDPVAWRHDLDDIVRDLNARARARNITLPNNFYFGFSRYLSQSPGDEQTGVLKKQLTGIRSLVEILINAPIRSLSAVRRTYEEDAPASSGGGERSSDGDRLPGSAVVAAGGAYTAYPFEVEFTTTPENLRGVVDNIIHSPYLFVIRSLSIQNEAMESPRQDTLDKMAGSPTTSTVVDSAPGEVAANTAPKAPQYLFGDKLLKVKLRLDMIEWNPVIKDAVSASTLAQSPPAPGGPHHPGHP